MRRWGLLLWPAGVALGEARSGTLPRIAASASVSSIRERRR
jgi:hypothetical protein